MLFKCPVGVTCTIPPSLYCLLACLLAQLSPDIEPFLQRALVATAPAAMPAAPPASSSSTSAATPLATHAPPASDPVTISLMGVLDALLGTRIVTSLAPPPAAAAGAGGRGGAAVAAVQQAALRRAKRLAALRQTDSHFRQAEVSDPWSRVHGSLTGWGVACRVHHLPSPGSPLYLAQILLYRLRCPCDDPASAQPPTPPPSPSTSTALAASVPASGVAATPPAALLARCEAIEEAILRHPNSVVRSVYLWAAQRRLVRKKMAVGRLPLDIFQCTRVEQAGRVGRRVWNERYDLEARAVSHPSERAYSSLRAMFFFGVLREDGLRFPRFRALLAPHTLSTSVPAPFSPSPPPDDDPRRPGSLQRACGAPQSDSRKRGAHRRTRPGPHHCHPRHLSSSICQPVALPSILIHMPPACPSSRPFCRSFSTTITIAGSSHLVLAPPVGQPGALRGPDLRHGRLRGDAVACTFSSGRRHPRALLPRGRSRRTRVPPPCPLN